MDCRFIINRDFARLPEPIIPSGNRDTTLARQQEYDYALFHIDSLLRDLSSPEKPLCLEAVGLPAPSTEFDQFAEVQNRLLREEMGYNYDSQSVRDGLGSLNEGQKAAADAIINAVEANAQNDGQGAIFFLTGPGGTGKTKVQNTVLAHFRASRRIALAVASSGIAATLLEGGRTAHSRFKIPLDADSTAVCGISKGTNLARLMELMELLIWDEAPMQSKYDMQAVDRCLRDICNSSQPFGGKVVCFCGDFRQTLPVVPGAKPGQIILTSIRNASFWEQVEVLHLTENMRLRNPDLNDFGRQEAREFAHTLLQIGDGATVLPQRGRNGGMAPWSDGRLASNELQELIDRIYSAISSAPTTNDYLAERAILAVTNRQVSILNSIILDRLPGHVYDLFSANEPVYEEDEDFTPEFLAAIIDPSLPDHHLRLKKGMPVMLLRNLEPPRLCNGSRIRLTFVGAKVLKGELMAGTHQGEEVLIPRIPLQSKDNAKIPCQFKRLQFTVKPAFAMTVNKSQGQSMKHVGTDLQSGECFSHGQLYVALSRVTSK